jgi:hypothetical protein
MARSETWMLNISRSSALLLPLNQQGKRKAMTCLRALLIAILSTGLLLGQTQTQCPKGQGLVGDSCAPMCWQDDCQVPIPCGSRVSTGISIIKPRSACLKYESALAANRGCPLGSQRKDTSKGCYSCVANTNPKMCLEYEDGFFSKEIKIKCGTGRWTSCAPTD